jgi:hypothetical protein
MAEPAHAGTEPAARKSDPRAPGWADVPRTVITCAHAAARAVAELARHPDDRAAMAMAELTRQALESAVSVGQHRAFEEADVEARCERAYAAGVADCKAARCRLSVVDGG